MQQKEQRLNGEKVPALHVGDKAPYGLQLGRKRLPRAKITLASPLRLVGDASPSWYCSCSPREFTVTPCFEFEKDSKGEKEI